MTDAEKLDRILSFQGECLVEWQSMWPGCLVTGNEVNSTITHRCTVHDAINVVRAKAKAGKVDADVDSTDAHCIGLFMREYKAQFIVPSQLGI